MADYCVSHEYELKESTNSRTYDVVGPEDCSFFDEPVKVEERGDMMGSLSYRSDDDILAYAMAHPVNAYEEEEVYRGIEADTLDAVQLEVVCEYVENYSKSLEEHVELADRMNRHVRSLFVAAPSFVYHEVNDRGKTLFHATVDFEGWHYAVGPCTVKKELNKEFLQMFFSETGKYVYLMARFLNDSFDYVSSVRKESFRWIVGGGTTVLETERGGLQRNWKSTLPGIRGVGQCCFQYLKTVMGFEIISKLSNVPGYQEKSVLVWQKLIGMSSSREIYSVLKDMMLTQHDRRVPQGDKIVDGIILALVVENRMDYYDVVRRSYLSKMDIVNWMQKRYGATYAVYVSNKVMAFRCTIRELSAPINEVGNDRASDSIDGVRLMRSISRVLGAFPLGLRMNEIVREVKRTWIVDTCEIGYVLCQYLDVKWDTFVVNGVDKYFLRRSPAVHFLRYGDDCLREEDRYERWRGRTKEKTKLSEKLQEVFGFGQSCSLSDDGGK